MMRRWLLIALGGIAVAAAAVGTVVLIVDDDAPPDQANASAEPEVLNTAVAVGKDFVESTELDGTLGFGAVENLPNHVSGIVTWLPEPGTIKEFGDVLYMVDGRPVILLAGDEPMYRPYNSGTTDGSDVLHLEELLFELGYHDGDVDGTFTSLTESAIELWEEDLGIEPTGEIALGMIVYRPEPLRISAVNSAIGSRVNGTSVVSVTSTERFVSVHLDPALTEILDEGDRVQVELADGTMSLGTVSQVSAVAVTDGAGPAATSYLPTEILLEASGERIDESPVTVHVEEVLEADVIAVPIASLLALAEGGYAVEVVVDAEPVLTSVELGTFLDNEVSILGGVRPGDEVVVP